MLQTPKGRGPMKKKIRKFCPLIYFSLRNLFPYSTISPFLKNANIGTVPVKIPKSNPSKLDNFQSKLNNYISIIFSCIEIHQKQIPNFDGFLIAVLFRICNLMKSFDCKYSEPKS